MAMDILGPFPENERGNSFAIPNQEASTVANVFVDEIFMLYAIPKQLHSDQGSQFESWLMLEVCK